MHRLPAFPLAAAQISGTLLTKLFIEYEPMLDVLSRVA